MIIILRKLTLLSYVHFCNVDFTIKEILKDPNEVQQLMHNLSIPPSVSEGLLNTTVNTKEVKRKKNCTGVLLTLWTVLLALSIMRVQNRKSVLVQLAFEERCILHVAVILSSSPRPLEKKQLMSRIDYCCSVIWIFPPKLHLPITLNKNRIHQPVSKIH